MKSNGILIKQFYSLSLDYTQTVIPKNQWQTESQIKEIFIVFPLILEGAWRLKAYQRPQEDVLILTIRGVTQNASKGKTKLLKFILYLRNLNKCINLYLINFLQPAF